MKTVPYFFAFVLALISISACANGGEGPGDVGDAGAPDASSPDAGVDGGTGLPHKLPFEFTRPDEGEPLTDAEVTAFTKKLTGFMKDVDFFKWVLRISHGMDATTGYPDWMIWWHDVDPIKQGDVVQWHHGPRGGAHNPIQPTTKMLVQAASGYMMTGDPVMGRIVEQYSKGLTSTMKGMIFDENDQAKYLMSRQFITRDHDFVIEGDKKKSVVMHDWFSPYDGWNASRFEYRNNPYWGDIWVTNLRSKDDVPHIYIATAFLRYVAEQGKDKAVRDAAAEAVEWMEGFARDIVESNYYIRTKDKDGKPFISDQDLGCLACYEWLDPKAECNAKLATALIGYKATLKNNCGGGGINAYDRAVVASHYYNLEIVRTFHLASIVNALVTREDAVAKKLMAGLTERINEYMSTTDQSLLAEPGYFGNLAVFLLESTSMGFPLTSREARLVHKHFSMAADEYRVWNYWNLWNPAIPDGQYPYVPEGSSSHVVIEDIAWALAYCYSPLRNGSGAKVVDCEIIRDPSKW
jgi:hypothetical protein